MIAEQFDSFVTMVMSRFDDAYRKGVQAGVPEIKDAPFPGIIKVWRGGQPLATVGGSGDLMVAHGVELATLFTRVLGVDSIAISVHVEALHHEQGTGVEGLMMHIFTRGGDGFRTVRLYQRSNDGLRWLSEAEQVNMLNSNWGWDTRPDVDSPFATLMTGGFRLGPAIKPGELGVDGVTSRAAADMWGFKQLRALIGNTCMVMVHVDTPEHRVEHDKLQFGDYLQEN